MTANSGIDGVIAAQGDLGALVGTTRLGGLLSHGPLRGEIVTPGRILGDMEAVFSPSAFDLSGQGLGGLNLILQHPLAVKGSGGALSI